MFAEDYVYQRTGEAVLSYLEIYNRLTEELRYCTSLDQTAKFIS